MRIAVVGPTHPFKGGIAQHTTALAHRLAAAGHDVQIVSWARQYPQRLYPGQQTIDDPEFERFVPTGRLLSWSRPDTWVRTGRRLRDLDVVVIAHTTPVQAPAYRALASAARAGGARIVIVSHNVLPHERSRLDELLVRRLLDCADRVIVHSEREAGLARALTRSEVLLAPLPPHLPPAFTAREPEPGQHNRLLFFGLVRPYKGLDVLLRALATGPADVTLRVAGEFWGGVEETVQLCRELGVEDRVEIRAGYVAAAQVPELFADVDALVLPYRSATGSQGVWAAFAFGVPVIVTRSGPLADGVRDDVDGIVVEPDDVEALAVGLRRFYAPGVPLRLRAGVTRADEEPIWSRYLAAVTGVPASSGLAPTSNGLAPTRRGTQMAQAAPPGGKLLGAAKIGAEYALWGRVRLQGNWAQWRGTTRRLPSVVPPTDVLDHVRDYQRAVQECRRLGLPLHRDKPKNWDALGAVSIVLHELGTGARVLDAGAARYSSILPWLRLYGLRDLVGNNLEFTRVTRHGPVRFEPGDITAMPYQDASFDAVTCMSVIEHGVPLAGFATETARVLRPGGLLVISTDYDEHPPDTTGKTAYGNPVTIFGPDEMRSFVALAAGQGLQLLGDLRLENAERPVHWARTGLDYTFIRVTFRRT